jgi:hypothetical protein
MLEEDQDERIKNMKPDDVYKLSALFQEYELPRFKTNLASLKKSLGKDSSRSTIKSTKTEPWRHSEAKAYLTALLQTDSDGEIHRMDPQDVFKMSDLFKPYEFHNFKTNLENLKETLKKGREMVQIDEEAFLKDQSVIPRKTMTSGGYSPWNTSPAKTLLEQDVRENKHNGIKPRAFQLSRPEYQEFPLTVFRKHIYQEEYAQTGRSYWMHKKKLKMMAAKK